MNKKGLSKKHQRRLTLVGITSVVTIWVAALALLFSQPGEQSNGKALPTLAVGLEGVAVLPDTGAPMSPTILPTSLPVELPPGSQADTVLVSNPANPIADISPTQPALLNIPDEPVPNSMVIRFEPELSQAERLAYITSLGGQIVQEIKPLNTVIINLPANTAAGIQSQSIPSGVLENEPDYYAGALYSPNDSLAAGQWGLDAVKAPQAWDLLPVSTPSVTVAVIDSGICVNHADLQGRIAPDGWDFIDNDSTPQDDYGHGCAVAGIIAANSNNNLGIAGVAPNANVLALRVLDADGIGRYSNVAAAIVYAVDNGVGAINLSLGGPNPSAVLQDAVNYAEANGVTVIAAAGNNGAEQVFYPAAYPAVVAVGSVSQNLQRSAFSNYGDGIDLYAPGDGITTTSLDGSFQNYSGTSVAAPYVTGVWALRQAMGKNLVQDGGIVSALYASDAPVPTEAPPSELCLLSETQAAETAYFDLVQQNAAQPGSVSAADIEAARSAYLGLAGQCANALYDDNMTIDGGGISPFGGEISPLFQIFGTKWQQAADGSQVGDAFNQGQPPAVPGGVITYSFMPSNVSLASKEVENGGGSNALVTAISDLPTNLPVTTPPTGNATAQLEPICDLQGRIRQAFEAWESVANVEFVEITETGLVPFGTSGAVGDMRIGAQIIDGMKGELGHAYFPPPDPEIVTSTRSGDIFLDRSEVWGCAPSAAGVEPRVIDIGLVMLHELGHALGMQHERAAGVLALMNPTYNTALLIDDAGGNTLSLTQALKGDDQSGARAIYGGIGVSAPALQPVLGTETDNTPTLPWRDTVPGGSDYFEVEIYLSNNGQPGDVIFDGTTSGGNNPADPPAKSFTVPNTLQSLPYVWRVRAFDEGAYGVWSDFAPFAITVGIPAPLSPTAGQVLNSGDVRFLWGTVPGTNSYLLQIATQAEFTPESLIVDETVTGAAFTPSTLTDGTYYWRVQTGNNPFSIVNSFKVDAAALVVDLSPGAANVSPANGFDFTGAGANEGITLEWDALEGVTEYQLQLDTSENFVGLLFLDKLFLDKLFLDKLFLDKLFLDKLFLDKLFLDKLQTSEELFLDKLFLDKLFLDKLFLDKLFLDKLFLDKLFLDKLFLDKLFLDKLFLDKLFLDKLFLDKIEYSGGDTASFSFDSLPLSEGVHYWRVRPRLPDGSFGPWSESRSFNVRTQDTKVVINEIKLSDPSWIEFHNTGTETANMAGWQFFAYGPSGETQLLYTFPAGFTLQPGGYSVLYEGVGTDTDRALYTGGSQIDWPLTAQGESVTGEALNGFGSVVPGLNFTTAAETTGVESASLAAAPTAVIAIGPNGELVANGVPLVIANSIQADATSTVEPVVTAQSTPPAGISTQADDDLVTAQTAFNIAIGDTVTTVFPGAGAGNIESAGSTDTYTFAATAGQVIYLDNLSYSNSSLDWRLNSPSNAVIFNTNIYADGGRRILTETGNYVITVNDNSNSATGTYSFKLWGATIDNFAINPGDTISNGIPAAGAGNIETPGSQDVYTFSGTTGQIVYFDGISTSSSLYMTLTSPTSVAVFSGSYITNDGGRVTLAETGTYKLTVGGYDATYNTTGTYSFKLWNVAAPQNFAINVGDTVSDGVPSAGAGNIETPGAQDIYTFSADLGDIIFFDGISTSDSLYATLTSPTSVAVFTNYYISSDAGRYTLPESGTYTLTVKAYGNTYDDNGTYSFKLWDVPAPQNFAISVGDTVSTDLPSAGAGNIEAPGAQDIYTFSATAGDIVFFDELGASDYIYWKLTSPTSAIVFNSTYGDAGRFTLPATGTYTLTWGGYSNTDDVFGTYSFKLWAVGAPQNFAINIGDTVSNGVPNAGAGNIETPGARDIYTFNATAGDVVFFDGLAATDDVSWKLTSPSAVVIFNDGVAYNGGKRTLGESGTYTLQVGGYNDLYDSAGTYSFKLWTVPTPDEFVINIGDSVSNGVPGAGAGNIEIPGAQDIYTFTAAAGQQVYFEGISTSYDLRWELTSPSDTEIFSTYIGYDAGKYTLNEVGIYTITVSSYYDYNDSIGSYGFKLWTVPAPQNFAINIGDMVGSNVPGAGAGIIEAPGAEDIYTFNATAGAMVVFDSASQYNDLYWSLTSPSNIVIFDTSLGNDGGLRTLNETGTYTIRAYGPGYYGNNTGSYSFRLAPNGSTEFAIAIGQSVSNGNPNSGAGNISPAGNVDTYVFAGTAGQTLTLDTLSGTSANLTWRLVAPGGAQLFDTPYADQNSVSLTTTGTYTLTVQGISPVFTGTYSFRLINVVAPQSFPITVGSTVSNGQPAAGAGNIEVPGARDQYTFSATSGQTLYFASLQNYNFYWELRGPTNNLIFNNFMYTSTGGQYLLSQTGTFTLSVYDTDGYTGSYSFSVTSSPAAQNFAISVGDMISEGVPSVGAGRLEQAGSQDVYSFSGVSGQTILVDALDPIPSDVRWELRSPTNVQIFNQSISSGSGTQPTLTETGTYTLRVYSNFNVAARYSFKLWGVSTPQNFNIAIGDTISNGVPATGAGNIEETGSQDIYTFNATAGQIVHFDVNGTNNYNLNWRLTGPSSNTIFDNSLNYGYTNRQVLPTTGAYKLTVYGTNSATGIYGFTLWNATQQPFNIAIGDTVSNGVPTAGAGNIEANGAEDIYTFAVTAGQVVYFDALTASNSNLIWELRDTTNYQLFRTSITSDTSNRTLYNTGNYQLIVYGAGAGSGSYSFKLWEVPPADEFNITIGDIVADGVPEEGAGNIEQPGVEDTYSFTATEGQVVSFDAIGVTTGLQWELYRGGNYVFNSSMSDTQRTLTAGTHTLRVYSYGDTVRRYSFRLAEGSAGDYAIAIGSTVSNGNPAAGAGNIETNGNTDTYVFAGAAGQFVTFDTLVGTNTNLQWELSRPSGSTVFSGAYTDRNAILLPVTGTYTLTVEASVGNPTFTGTYSFQLVENIAPASYPIALDDTVSDGVPAVGAGIIEKAGDSDLYTFAATANQMVTFDVISGNSALLAWRLLDPDNMEVFSTYFTDRPDITLLKTGTYSLTVQASAGNESFTGTYSFQIATPAAPTPTPTNTPTSTPTATPTPSMTPTMTITPAGDLAQPGPNLVVNNASDINDGVCSNFHCSLREAINRANVLPNTDNITFSFDTLIPILLTNGELTISQPVTITAGPVSAATISGQNESRVFNITSGNLTLDRIAVVNGRAADGAAIRNGNELTIINSIVSSNLADNRGVILNEGIATISGSIFYTNTATNGAAVIENNGVMTLENSNLFGNFATNGNGGAVINNGSLTISGTTFTNNSAAGGDGGAIYNLGELIVSASTFSDLNEAVRGGAIFTDGDSQMTLTNVTVSGNSANSGGGIYSSSPYTASHVINFSTITNNTNDGIFVTDLNVTIKNSIITDQVSGTNCDGADISASGVNFADDATCEGFTNTSQPLIGGLGYNSGRVNTHALIDNSPAREAATDCTTVAGVTVTEDARFIPRPQGTECDAGAYEFGGDLSVTTTQIIQDGLDGKCSLPEAIIAANTNTPSGSAAGECVPTNNNPEVITLGANQTYRLTQVDNTADGPNGLPVITETNLYVYLNGSTIIRAADAPDMRILQVAPGASLYFTNAGIISGGRLNDNDYTGAGILNQGSLISGGVTFENNVAAGDGGAIFNSESATTNLFSNIFRNNQAGNGGAIANTGTVINNGGYFNRFENNRASGDGGAIFIEAGSVTLDFGIFLDNRATDQGGAVYNNAFFSGVNATFSGNQAAQGAAVFNNSGTANLIFTTIAENTTTSEGSSAVQDNGGALNVISSIVANNSGGNCNSAFASSFDNIEFPGETCGDGFQASNPLLAAKVDEGFLVYYPLLVGSPAIDALSTLGCPYTGANSVARPVGTGCEIGSWEGVGIPLTGDLTVTTTQTGSNPGDGLCSLTEAINAANNGENSGNAPGECVPNSSGADTITLGTGLTYALGYGNNNTNGDNGLPVIASPITINGNGSTITRNSESLFRIFYVGSDGSLTLNNATLSNGFGDPGGAILSDGSLTLNFVSIANNFGSSGGGLFLNGDSTINNSSITGNNALSPDGGGIFVANNATLTMTNSTVASNIAANVGGGVVTGAGSNVVVQIINSTIANNTAVSGAGIAVYGGSLTVYNTIIANNTGGNCSGNVGGGDSNIQWPDTTCTDTILTADPVLGPLTGSPAYLPLGTDSAAIDAADPAYCPAIDQRGIPRNAATCDIGAIELTEAPALVPGTTGGAAALVSPVTTDFVRFGDTTIGPANASEWTGDNVAVTDSSDNNVTIGRDPSSSDTNHVTDWATQRPTEGGQNFTNVLINEIFTGSNDYVELYNPRAETADISNWELKLYDGNDQLIAAPGATYTVRFPAGTLLRPGQFLVVGEQNPGSGIDFIAVPTIDWDDANASGAVTLTNGLTAIDFVRFGSSQANQLLVEPPAGSPFTGVVQSPLPGESIGRNSISEDANAAPDWYSQVRSAGAVNPAISPPANDNFTGATTIDSLPFRDTGDTTNASAVNDPVLSCGASVGHTIWYKYTPTVSQTIRLQTDGSDFDTVLAVFTVDNNTPTQIDDLCSQRDDENNTQPGSRLSVPLTAGQDYYILIGGQLNVSGQYIFSVNAPLNDDVANASLIGSVPFRTFDPNTGVATVNTTAATILDGEPVPTCAPSAGRTVWYRYEATDATKLRLRTAGTLFDTVITVYTGTPENLVEVICNNDDASDTSSDLGFTPVPGTTYYFQVSGNSDQGGNLLFEVDVFPAPDNDLIGDAYAVTPDGDGTFSVTTLSETTAAPFNQDTTGATSTDDPVLNCALNAGATVWFSYTANTADTVIFQTFGSKYDTSLTIWTGDLLTPASLTQIGCNDDVGVNKNSRLTLGDITNGVVADVQITVGTTYYIGVSGYFGETGDLVFNAFTPQTAAPENDRVTSPYEITFNPDDGTYSVIGQPAGENTPFVQDTTGAFPALVIDGPAPDGEADITVPTPTCGDDVGYTVWYKYAAPERQQIVFDAAGSDFDTVITAYVLQGNQLVEVGCNDDFEGRAQSKLTLNTDAGVTLYLSFGGFKRDRGNLGIVISQSIAVTSFTLVDAADGSAEVNPLLDGAVVAASELPDTISIRANTDPEEVGSVILELTADGNVVLTTTDNEAPYALNGSNPDGSYIPWLYVPGTYTLKATPYAGNNGAGRAGTALTITFTISDNQPPLIAADEDTITVNESVGAFNTGTFSDPDTDPVTLSASFGTVSDQGDGTWLWSTPTTDGPAESQTITITADDGQPGGETTVEFALVVVNVAPTANLSHTMPNATTARLTFSNPVDASSVDQAAGFKYSYDCTNDGTFETGGTAIDAATFDCVYTQSGNYTARGRIADKDGGFTDSPVDLTITIGNQPPVADAGDDQTVTATRPTLTANVTLDGSASDDPDGDIESYIWTENGVEIASGETAAVDLAIGTHIITLTVTDDEASQATDTVTIIVEAPANTAPTADAGDDQLVTDLNKNGSELVTLDGSGSTDADGDSTIVTYSWTENGVEIATGETAQVTLAVGQHTITLTVTDDVGAQDTDEVVIDIVAPAVVAPTANAGPDQVVNDNDRNNSELVTLNGTGSSDDGTIVSYSWSENGVEIATGATPQVTLSVGTHIITLTVTDDDNATGTDSVVVKVNAPPTANAGPDQTVSAGSNNVSLNGSGSTDSDGTIVGYTWTEGAVTLSTQVAPTITLPLGVHTITLTVTDNNGATGTDTVVITVIAANVPPTANAGPDQTVTDNDNNGSEIVTLNGTGSTDEVGIISYVWTENGIQIATGATPQVTLNVGSHTITLTVTDGSNATGTDTVVITVLPQNTGPITLEDQVELSSDDVNEDGNSYDARNPQLWFGSGQSVSKSYMGLRFNNLEIPQGAVITEAHIEVYTATAQWIRMRILVGGEAVDDSATFTSATRPSTRAFTTARLDYQSNAPWPAATWNDIGDVKAVVQEIVNRPGWLPGNSLSILIKGLGSQWGRKFVTSYDGNPAFAPRLVVSYAGGPPPTNNPPEVNVNAPSVTVNEGVLANISGTVVDLDNNPVTLTASLGTVQKNGNNWTWSYTPADGPLNQTVTISAADNRGGSDSVTFDLIVNNVAPTASFSAAPLSTYPNNPVTVTFSSPFDVAADLVGLTYTIDCGNGSVQTGAAASATCTYGAEGTFTVLGRITDKDGGYSDYQAVITVSSTPTAPTTITPQVNGSSDDVNENGASFQVNNSTVWVGTDGNASQSYTGLRFNNLGIPAGATITEAYLEFYVTNSQWIGVDVLIAGEAADNSATFSSGSRPSGRPVTTNRIEHHSNVNWAANNWYTLTGNLSGVVQEIVSRPGWQSGNSLSLILKGIGSRFGRKFVTSYDGNPAFAPRLVIKYTVPSAPAPDIIVPPPAPIILPTPPVAAFTSDVSSGIAPLAVTFSNQSTGDIASTSWDFGDGTGSTDTNPIHIYNGVGVFTVTLTVNGLDGTIVTAQAVITVGAPPPSIEVIPPPIEEATPAPTEEVSAATTEPPAEAVPDP